MFAAFAGATVLTAWTLHLGGGPMAVGALAALPFLAQFVHLPAAWVTARLGRRRVAIAAVGASRLVFLPLGVLPLIGASTRVQLAVLVAVAALSAVLGVIGNNAWVSWMGDLVPPEVRGRYFGRRTAICTVGGTSAALLAGLALDRARAAGVEGLALGGLALLACLAGAATTWLLAEQHEPSTDRARPALPRLRDAVGPLTDPRARRVLAYLVWWNAAVGVAGPFFAVHMIENLEMSFALIALQGASVAAVRVLALPWWGRALDRFGARPVLVAASFGISIVPLIWLLPAPGMLWPVALDALLSGLLWSAHGLAAFNLPLEVAPQQKRPFYLAAFSAAGGLAFAAASALGGILGHALPKDVLVLGHPMFGLHGLFVLSSAGRAFAAVLALRIVQPEAGSVPELLQVIRTRSWGAVHRLARLPRQLLRPTGGG